MIEVFPDLFVGNQLCYENLVKGEDGNPKPGWAVVHACKEPYHRQAVGYSGRAPDREDLEYLWARRGDRLCLNMVDVPDHKFIARSMIDTALHFIHTQMQSGKKVLVHCNQGGSRGPGIALLYLAWAGIGPKDFAEARDQFQTLYPAYDPAQGVRDFVELHWGDYRRAR